MHYTCRLSLCRFTFLPHFNQPLFCKFFKVGFLVCTEMNLGQNNKAHNFDGKQIPGCLGRMVNLFDLNTGVPGNRLLADKPHRDGSPILRSQSDVSRTSSPIEDPVEDKLIVSELRHASSNRKQNRIPMKMLLAQEMSKEVDSKHSPPNLVAKLMGLDTLPHQHHGSVPQRSCSISYERNIPLHSEKSECWQHERGFLDKQMKRDARQSQGQSVYDDAYEFWRQAEKKNSTTGTVYQKGRQAKDANDRKMALVRQKFVEAKRLATDERLRQSKEFQDALEVLSSNKDLLIKFLQEPNSLFSQHRNELHAMPPASVTKRITVLKPTKTLDDCKFPESGMRNEKQVKKPMHVQTMTGWSRAYHEVSPHFSNWKVEDDPQPTRIVVLKPSPGKADEIGAVVSPVSSSPRVVHGEDYFAEPEDADARESREVAKEITRHMRENLSGHRRDETLLSSVFSNGYTGDESSFNKSDNEYIVPSDSEVLSPVSRHSWDYINRFGSPFSSSSFSRASYSPESSVCREAKKRLSERWALMSLNGNPQEPRHVRRGSSTLGEMLSLSETKKSVASDESANKEQEPRGSTSCLNGHFNNEEGSNDSPRNLLRSKSVPVSSTAYGGRLNVELSGPEASKSTELKELRKDKSSKSTFKGKVSSLFFSRNKRSSKDKSEASRCKGESQTSKAEMPSSCGGNICVDHSPIVNGIHLEECTDRSLPASSPCLTSTGQNHKAMLLEEGLSVTKPVGNPCENQDQPSPVSVLDPPMDRDGSLNSDSSSVIKGDCQGGNLLVRPMKSNLIDKSPPIGSIARTLAWDDSCEDATHPYVSKHPAVPSGPVEEQDWFCLVQSLLSTVGIDSKGQANAFIIRWHSAENPLDPMLREKFIYLNDKEFLHEAKRRQCRSNRKLVFDCVNAALVDAARHGLETSFRGTSYSEVHTGLFKETSNTLADEVWARMKEWISDEVRCVWEDNGDSNSLVVERVVRKEVVGKGWVEEMQKELYNAGREIENKLLEELVEDACNELTGRV